MWTLIKREIDDHRIFFFLAAIFAAGFVFIIISAALPDLQSRPPVRVPEGMYVPLFWFLVAVSIVAAALGATQMFFDRGKRISCFLSTLATTRRRILSAKIMAGVLWILIAMLPVALTEFVLLQVFPRLVPVDMSNLLNLFLITFLAALASYSVGLLMGWNTNKFFPVLGSTAMTPVLLTVITIKGFGLHSAVILTALTAALMVRVWQRFMSTPL